MRRRRDIGMNRQFRWLTQDFEHDVGDAYRYDHSAPVLFEKLGPSAGAVASKDNAKLCK
jgi:hypothetical protein